jgi:hypothetical protein
MASLCVREAEDGRGGIDEGKVQTRVCSSSGEDVASVSSTDILLGCVVGMGTVRGGGILEATLQGKIVKVKQVKLVCRQMSISVRCDIYDGYLIIWWYTDETRLRLWVHRSSSCSCRYNLKEDRLL